MSYHGWTFANPAPAEAPQRATRFPLAASAQLFLRFESWQLCWSVPTVNISDSGLLCLYPVTDALSADGAVDLETLIQAEPAVRLQIDHDRSHLFSPIVWGDLVRCTRLPEGLGLAFAFSETDPHLVALVDELAGGVSHESKTH